MNLIFLFLLFSTSVIGADCKPRQSYPTAIQQAAPASQEGFSGLMILKGTGQPDGNPKKKYFSKSDFEKLTGAPEAGFTGEATFAIEICQTTADGSAEAQKQVAQAQSQWNSNKKDLSEFKKFNGEWCLRTEPYETRVLIDVKDDGTIGTATQTWRETPGGPLGKEGYVLNYHLVAMALFPGKLMMKAIPHLGRTETWHIDAAKSELKTKHGRSVLSKSCEGFWK